MVVVVGHNTGLYCTKQSTVRRGVEKQIKLQQTRAMQTVSRERRRERVGGFIKETVEQPDH